MTDTVYDLPLDRITIVADLQPRVAGLDEGHVRTLQEAPESWQPLVVVQQGNGYVLEDGFHRYAAAQNLELTTVPVRIVPPPADGDLRGLAFTLNASHGRPLSLADRRAEAERLLRLRPEVSNLEVSRRVGLSPTTVAAIRARLEETASISPTTERVGADGSRYPVGPTAPGRAAGQLPAVTLGTSVGNALGRLITPGERAQQRRIVQYLERLAVALEDQLDLEGWETAEDAAGACRLVLGEDKAALFGERLGLASASVLEVALALGFDDEAAA